MSSIENIRSGMRWTEVFRILNQVIAAVNSLVIATGSCISSERVDYNALANLPKLNGVTLTGNKSVAVNDGTADVSLSSDATLTSIASRVATVESQVADKAETTDMETLSNSVNNISERVTNNETGLTNIDSRVTVTETWQSNVGSSTSVTQFFSTVRQSISTIRSCETGDLTYDSEQDSFCSTSTMQCSDIRIPTIPS